MKHGTYRHLEPREIEPLKGRHFLGWGRDRAPREFELSGVAWSVPGHPEELLIVFQADTTDAAPPEHEPTAYTHIPYPHRLPETVRRFLIRALAYTTKREFIEQLQTLARERSE